jgi:SAM-dependent methyltransferase
MYHHPRQGHALCIGIAAGIVPMQLAQAGLTVDAIEINPAAVSLASKYFGFDTNRVKTFIQDGRYYLNKTETRYDLVVLDAYIGESCPNHLLSREAFEQIRRVLKPGGTLIMSSSADSQGGSQFFVGSVQKTLRAVFKQLRTHDTLAGSVFFVAGDHPLTLQPFPGTSLIPPEIRWITERTLSRSSASDESAGIVLTDDYNPMDFYDAKNREAIRRRIFEQSKEL